jgi:hypothetical protein
MSDKIVTLAMFHDPMAAEMTRSRLAAAGIPAMITGDNARSLFGTGVAMVQLQVAEQDVSRATLLLDEMEESLEDDPESSEAITEEERPRRRRRRHAVDESPELPLRESPSNGGIQADGLPSNRLPIGNLADRGIAATRLPPQRMPNSEEDGPLTFGPDEMANRAWRAAIIGLIVFPPLLHFYSLVLLLSMAGSTEKPSSSAARKMYGALAIDLVVVGVVGLVLWLAVREAW